MLPQAPTITDCKTATKRFSITLSIFAAAGLAGCAPAYVWGDVEKVERSLGKIVPIGASQTELLAEAKIQSWEVDSLNIKIAGIGKATWFDDCLGRGGLMVPVIIERYATPFETTVESMWLFDEHQKLADICVRKTTDAF